VRNLDSQKHVAVPYAIRFNGKGARFTTVRALRWPAGAGPTHGRSPGRHAAAALSSVLRLSVVTATPPWSNHPRRPGLFEMMLSLIQLRHLGSTLAFRPVHMSMSISGWHSLMRSPRGLSPGHRPIDLRRQADPYCANVHSKL
jgi:hypothetical protein